MLHIQEAIVVEGRYDKNTLSQVVDTVILETAGFGVFKNQELVALLRRLAEERGLIVLTDSDGAGFLIRSRLKSALPQDKVKHAYIPDVYGKERGKLGVEGMSPAVLEEVLRRAGATFLEESANGRAPKETITKADLYLLGLTGTPDSAQRRGALLRHLDLPEHMSTNALLPVLNALYEREAFLEEAESWM